MNYLSYTSYVPTFSNLSGWYNSDYSHNSEKQHSEEVHANVDGGIDDWTCVEKEEQSVEVSDGFVVVPNAPNNSNCVNVNQELQPEAIYFFSDHVVVDYGKNFTVCYTIRNFCKLFPYGNYRSATVLFPTEEMEKWRQCIYGKGRLPSCINIVDFSISSEGVEFTTDYGLGTFRLSFENIGNFHYLPAHVYILPNFVKNFSKIDKILFECVIRWLNKEKENILNIAKDYKWLPNYLTHLSKDVEKFSFPEEIIRESFGIIVSPSTRYIDDCHCVGEIIYVFNRLDNSNNFGGNTFDRLQLIFAKYFSDVSVKTCIFLANSVRMIATRISEDLLEITWSGLKINRCPKSTIRICLSYDRKKDPDAIEEKLIQKRLREKQISNLPVISVSDSSTVLRK